MANAKSKVAHFDVLSERVTQVAALLDVLSVLFEEGTDAELPKERIREAFWAVEALQQQAREALDGHIDERVKEDRKSVV